LDRWSRLREKFVRSWLSSRLRDDDSISREFPAVNGSLDTLDDNAVVRNVCVDRQAQTETERERERG
jgi:hypothetical protein